MSGMEHFSIVVPGSTSNLGPGFDSIGMAVNRFLKLKVTRAERWKFISVSEATDGIPEGKDNLIYKAAEAAVEGLAEDLPPCEVEVTSDIPMARGLGSSGAAIIAGIELANSLLDLGLSTEAKGTIASRFEGHPDNVGASLYGGLIIGTHHPDHTVIIPAGVPDFDLVAVIPDYELKTKEARSVLPESLPRKEAVKVSSVCNVLVASILKGNWKLAGEMMEQDMFHEPYRKELVPELRKARELSAEVSAYSAVLSGAGPTVLFYAPKGSGKAIKKKLEVFFQDCSVECLEPSESGVIVQEEKPKVQQL